MRIIILLSDKGRIMKKLLIIILLFLIVSCTNERSENNIYSIEGYFEAYFPGEPALYKSFENQSGSFVFYHYQDIFSNLHYVSNYVILKENQKDHKSFLYRIIHGTAMSWNGNVIKFKQIKHDGNHEIYYVSKTIKNNELVYECGVAAIKDNIYFQWVVEEIDGMVEAERIFNEKVKYFKVLK